MSLINCFISAIKNPVIKIGLLFSSDKMPFGSCSSVQTKCVLFELDYYCVLSTLCE